MEGGGPCLAGFVGVEVAAGSDAEGGVLDGVPGVGRCPGRLRLRPYGF